MTKVLTRRSRTAPLRPGAGRGRCGHPQQRGDHVVNKAQAQTAAHKWIAAFNNHDLVTKVLGDPAGTVRGKQAVRAYFAKALAAAPDLKFELLDVFPGVNSVAVYLRSNVRGLQLEVMELDTDGRIARVLVHHRDP